MMNVKLEYMGAFGMSREEKILPYMKQYLKNTYPEYVSKGTVKNLLAYFDKWESVNKKTPIFYDNPNHADASTLAALKYIQQQTGYPEIPIRVFLYGLYQSIKTGKVSVVSANQSLKKPFPISPKMLIYGGLVVTGLLAVGWISQNVTKFIPQK